MDFDHDSVADIYTPDGAEFGHFEEQGGVVSLTDAAENPEVTIDETNGIDMILDAHGAAQGFVDPNGHFALSEGTIGHVEQDPFGGTHVIDDLNPSASINFENGPNGETSVTDFDHLPLAVVRHRFAL